MKTLALSLALIVSVSALRGVEPDSPEHGALKSARAYLDKLKANQAGEAVAAFWDLDAFLASAFGLQYLDLAPAEKTATQQALSKFAAAPFGNPQMARLFSTIRIESAKLSNYSESLVGVTLDLSGDEGKFRGVNTLLFTQSGQQWRLVDQRQGTSMPLRTAIVMIWLEEHRNPDATIASILEKATARVNQAAEKR